MNSDPDRSMSVASVPSRTKTPSSVASASGGKWVRFDDTCSTETTISDTGAPTGGRGSSADIAPPRVSLAGKSSSSSTVAPAEIDVKMMPDANLRLSAATLNSMSSAQRSMVSQELYNGKLLAMIRPTNNKCPWITPAQFDPYKIPSSLASDKLALPVEEYVRAMEVLTNDFRFRFYTVCYRRVVVIWLLVSLFVLIPLLIGMRGFEGLILFAVVLVWVFVMGVGILLVMLAKRRILKNLNECVQQVNRILVPYSLLLGLDDQGQCTCHKIYIPYIYFNVKDCLPVIANEIRKADEHGGHKAVPRETIDLEAGGRQRQLSLEERADRLILKYSEAYVKDVVRKRIRFPARPLEGVSDTTPRHAPQCHCLCQYIGEHHFNAKPQRWYHAIC